MNKILLIICVSLTLVSCRKFLTEYSPSDVIPTTTADFGEILYADGYPENGTRTLYRWAAFLDDDIQCYLGPTNITAINFITSARILLQWQPDLATENLSFGMDINSWAKFYKLLLGVNVVIQSLDDAAGPQEQKDQFKGEAYVLRAFYHFMLVNFYSRPYNDSTTTPDKIMGVPIRVDANLSDSFMTRSSVKEVYDQIASDLDMGIELLERKKKFSSVFRISHIAAHLLASRVHLYMENWDKAVYHADKVLAVHPQLMDYNSKIGVPVTMEDGLVGPTNVESIWCYGNARERYPEGYGFTYDVSADLVQTFEPDDLRRSIAIYEIPDFLKPYVAIPVSQQKQLGDYNSGNKSITNSWRSSEAYLNRAEAYIQKYRISGNSNYATEALESLNILRSFRFPAGTYQPWGVEPGDVLLQMCRDERRRELFCEEAHRWFDLRRYGMPTIKHIYTPDIGVVETYTLNKRDPQYVMPIPDEVLTKNPALIRDPLYEGIRMKD
ncbi:MAG TPA: RagB/SusD family nutrient uptake outer membrane protein [Parasegetibacter sp.]|jgi:hypothetical protein